MNERLKAIRKALGLNQVEFGARIGVTPGAISRLEVGSNNLTDQTIVSVCREFGINESWLRTGEGEMRATTEDALILQLTEKYGLAAIDRIWMKIWLNLPVSKKKVFNEVLLDLVKAATMGVGAEPIDILTATTGVEAANEATLPEPTYAEQQTQIPQVEGTDVSRISTGELTEDELVELYRQRLRASKRGNASSMTSASSGTQPVTTSTEPPIQYSNNWADERIKAQASLDGQTVFDSLYNDGMKKEKLSS